MRLMLGYCDNEPDLLVRADVIRGPDDFDFYVINGAWYGRLTHGVLHVSRFGEWSIGGHDMKIICDNQDRLRGDYADVFRNYRDPNYVAPIPISVNFSDMDDDIPF